MKKTPFENKVLKAAKIRESKSDPRLLVKPILK